MANTPDSTRAMAQTDEATDIARTEGDFAARPGEHFVIGQSVKRATKTAPYDRQPGDPIYRPLKVYALDPAESKLAGAQASVNVPYEPLEPGPVSALFEVIDQREDGQIFQPVDLDSPQILIRNGLEASPSNPQFHQQMVYAVCSTVYASFRRALGRQLHWGFGEDQQAPVRLRIRPHHSEDRNACYSKDDRELQFGYYKADDDSVGKNVPRGYVFTCLSHDIIAHEVSHALLDGLRPHFAYPSNSDVLALHEAIGDLVAIFQHFSYPEVVAAGIREGREELRQASLLTDLARQFGHTTKSKRPLRSAVAVIEEGKPKVRYSADLPVHELGSVLVTAVFEAFTTVYDRKVRDYLRLATGGTGQLPPGEMPEVLQRILAREASRLASQFLSVCIRAIDYCPPLDVTFGDYLRAMITADFDLVPDDPWAYREALIDAFRVRGIYPGDVQNLAEDALLWRPPERPIQALREARELRFRGDPGRPVSAREMAQQARLLGRLVTQERYMDLFGLVRPGNPSLKGDQVDAPCVESVRSSRRIGPDGQILFDLVAEVVQRRASRRGRADFFGGATVLIGPEGHMRYVIRKNIVSDERLARQVSYAEGAGAQYWSRTPHESRAAPNLFRLLHRQTHGQGTRRD